MGREKRLDRAVKQALESGEIGNKKPPTVSGYQKFFITDKKSLYINKIKRISFLHISDNENGMGGASVKVKMADGTTQKIKGVYSYSYEEAIKVIKLTVC